MPNFSIKRADVAALEQLDVHVRVEFLQAPQLAILVAHLFRLHCRQFDVQVLVGQVEVGREGLGDVPSASRSSGNVRGSYCHGMP